MVKNYCNVLKCLSAEVLDYLAHQHISTSALFTGAFSIFVFVSPLLAQPVVDYITPDRASAGMCIAVEFIGPYNQNGNFGNDGDYDPGVVVALQNAADSASIIVGPSVVSWNGKLVQAMLL